MVTQTIRVLVPAAPAMPRGAQWAAGWFQPSKAMRFLRRVAAALRAAPSDAERSAAAVRALANSYRLSDPGFASDLFAAVDRYEAQAGVSDIGRSR